MKLSSDSQGNKYFSFEDNEDDLIENIEEVIGNKSNDFDILQVLSENKEAEVKGFVAKVRSRKNDKIYSMKKIYLTDNGNINLQNVNSFMNKLIEINHPHILRYYTYFREGNNIYLIMEYMDNSDILGYIQAYQIFDKNIPEIEIWNILLQCLSALNYLSELNVGNIGIKLTNIFINNMHNIKIGVFRDFETNNKNIDKNEEIDLLKKYFYVMIQSLKFQIKDLDNIGFLNGLEELDFKNDFYSKELIDFMNNEFNRDIPSLYKLIQIEYAKIFSKNSSIKAVVKCLSSYKIFTDELIKDRKLIESNEKKYYMTNWFLKALDALNGINEDNLSSFAEEFRRALASLYTKLDGNKEIEPLLVFSFLLNKIHKETNKIDANQLNYSGYNTYIQNTRSNKNYVFDGEEKDRTNKPQMLQEFVDCFGATMCSPISNNFISFMKNRKQCKNCFTCYYSFSTFLYIVFDLTKMRNEKTFDLINDGFNKNHNTPKTIGDDKSNPIRCERCQTNRVFEEFNRYYMINNILIICFNRGHNYEKLTPISFEEYINVKDFIEPGINTAKDFYLVGSINRKIQNQNNDTEFVSYNRNPINDKWKSNGDINTIKKNQADKKEQIVMLFYKSKDN